MLAKNYNYKNARFPVKLLDWKIEKTGLVLTAQDNFGDRFYIQINTVKKNIARIRIWRDQFEKPFYDCVNNQMTDEEHDCSIILEDAKLQIETAEMKLILGTEFFTFRIENGKKRTVYEEQLDDVDSVGEGYNRIMPMGYTTDDTGHLQAYNVCARLRPNEHIFGLGERFTEFDRRGQSVRMWNQDSLGCRDEQAYKNIPFYLSSEGYGLFVNNPGAVEFAVGTESNASLSIHCQDTSLEYYIITGNSAKEIVRSYTNLTGPAALPPAWSFGLWYSVGFKGTDEEMVLKDAEQFRKMHIPCDVFHFDCYWLREDMWCDFVWDDKMYPNRKKMLAELKENHYKICLWINPYVTVRTTMYEEGNEAGYFIRNSKGETYLADLWHGLLSLCAVLDVTKPEAVMWFKEKLRGVLDEGIDVLKTDFGEDIPEDSIFYNGKTGREMRNVYSSLYNEIVFNTVRECGKEGIVWARSGGAGMQRYPVCWSGDPRSCYEGMAGVLKSGLSAGISGVPFWSHDMGGFYGKVSDEVFVRWCQFGVFSSHCRLHGTTARQPWAFSKEACAIVTDYIRLRYRLMPYILKTAGECARLGEPFIRPLFIETDEPAAAMIWDEYYFGEDIIVAPVFGGDRTIRDVYLPIGSWTDMLTGKEYEGGRWYRLECRLDYMPVFIKAGAVIPMAQGLNEYCKESW